LADRRFTATGVALLAIVTVALAAACASERSEDEGTRVRMDFARSDFFAAPFPSDDLLGLDGAVRLEGYPNPRRNAFIEKLTGMIAGSARGFATTGGVFFTLTGPVDVASLPDLEGSTREGASVFLVGIDPESPDFMRRYPVHVAFAEDAGPFAAPHMLSVVPLQGIPLLPRRTYAAVVSRAVRDARGHSLAPAPEIRALAAGTRPSDLGDDAFATYARAISALGASAEELVALAVFTTADPTSETIAVARDAARAPPTLAASPSLAEVFEGYCVYTALVSMPSFQVGTPPFGESGGEWKLDPTGRPIVQRYEASRVVLTVPRVAQPTDGYPLAVMIRTGAGGDRPLVDRGVQDSDGVPLAPGNGLARELARAGFVGASVDGPHGGLRNVTGGDEQFLVFNVDNVAAIRDNVRQTAVETVLFERVLEDLSFDASDCPGVGVPPLRIDPTRVALIGHSMGATIAPLALAAEPRFRGAVLSGAGASWMENLLHKEKPLLVRPIIEILLGYRAEERMLVRGDPALTLVQWALEPADPLVYAPLLVRAPAAGEAPRQILVEQGIVDHYIMPPIANALTLSLGLDLAGDALDETSSELRARPEQTPIRALLPYGGRAQITLPASGNAPNATAIVRQHLSDGVQDGHEILFQLQAPKTELVCFLESLSTAPARVPDGASGSCL
jgi:pimeloyl-ACP methyl ester carboxylesterase